MSTEFQTERQVVTRSPHPCLWCGREIAAGQRVLALAQRFAGEFYSGWLHPECEAAWRTLSPGDSFDPGGMVRGKCEPQGF